MYITMDVTFFEKEYFYTSVPSTSDHQGENADGNLSWLDLGGDVTVKQRVEPGTINVVADIDSIRQVLTKPILGEYRPATAKDNSAIE